MFDETLTSLCLSYTIRFLRLKPFYYIKQGIKDIPFMTQSRWKPLLIRSLRKNFIELVYLKSDFRSSPLNDPCQILHNLSDSHRIGIKVGEILIALVWPSLLFSHKI